MGFLKKIFAKQEVKTQNETKPKNEERVENQEKIQATVEMFYERLKNTSQNRLLTLLLKKINQLYLIVKSEVHIIFLNMRHFQLIK